MWSVIVQAGGLSKRMGVDKAMLPFKGQVLISRILDRVKPLGDEVVVIANDIHQYHFLPVTVVKDLIGGYGPLGGMYSAFRFARNPFVLIVACDMPFLNVSLLREQQVLLESGDYDVVIPALDKGLEPLHAVFRRERCLALVEQAIENGERRAISWMDRAIVRKLTESEIRQKDPRMLSFFNINTPAELEFAKKLDENC